MADLKYYDGSDWTSTQTIKNDEVYVSNGVTPPNNEKLWIDTSETGVIPTTYGVADNVTTSTAGASVLDAHQGKVLQDQITLLMDLLVPVGVVLTFASDVDPNDIYDGTTWEQIKDTFLLGKGTTYTTLGGTGGSANAIVVSHSHTFTGTAVTSGTQSANHTHSVSSSGAHNHTARFKGFSGSPSTSGYYYARRNVSGDSYDTTGTITHSADGAHTHTTGNNSANHTHSVTAKGTISTNGSSATGANMPPYTIVNFWKRTA